MVAVSDFSGLVSSACALASAAAIAPIDSLDCCMARLGPGLAEEFEADRARLRSLSPDSMAKCFFGVLRDQALQFGLGLLMVQESRPGSAVDTGKCRPGVRCAHVDDANGVNARPRRLDPE